MTQEHERYPVLLICEPGSSMTQQSFKNECDINRIMKRYKKSGELIHVNVSQGRYGDFSTETDYQSAFNAVRDAQRDFDALPAEIRKTMNNNPAELLRFIEDPANRDQAIEIGLIDSADPPPIADPPTSAQPPVASPPASPMSGVIAGGE